MDEVTLDDGREVVLVLVEAKDKIIPFASYRARLASWQSFTRSQIPDQFLFSPLRLFT